MGASVSVPGHFSHGEHGARFKRVSNDCPPAVCGMCQANVELGAAAYRCCEPGCSFVLHDACYRRPKTLKQHFGHQQHRLTLGRAARRWPCSLCAQQLGALDFAYSCTDTGCASGGFHAHPRCCSLPQEISAQHQHGKLVLRGQPAAGGNGDARQRRCLGCERVATNGGGRAAPWSYQCRKCNDVDYCLACLLGNEGSTLRCGCFPRCNADASVAVPCLGHFAGTFFCAFLAGMGLGCPPVIVPTRQMNPGNMAGTNN